MESLGIVVIVGLLIGMALTLLACVLVTVVEFGRVAGQSCLRFRLRSLFIVMTVIQAALALAVWQSQGATSSPADFLWLFGRDLVFLVFLGAGGWTLWYILEEVLRLFGWEHPVYRRYHARRNLDTPAGPADGNRGRRKKWWTKRWENRWRPLYPGQDHTHPIGRDKF